MVGVSGVSAARSGARVTLSDCVPDALHVGRINASKNGVTGMVDFSLLNWHNPDTLKAGSYDLVVGSEVLYISSSIRPLSRVVHAALREGGVAILADAGRGKTDDMMSMLDDLGMECEVYDMAAVASSVCVLKAFNIVVARKGDSELSRRLCAEIAAACDIMQKTRTRSGEVKFGYCLEAVASGSDRGMQQTYQGIFGEVAPAE